MDRKPLPWDTATAEEVMQDIRDVRKGKRHKPEKVDKPVQTFPNRTELRSKGIGVGRGGYRPFSRLTRAKLTPASIETHTMIHHTSETGNVRKMRVPRDQVVRKDSA
jgi:hypothetical protein